MSTYYLRTNRPYTEKDGKLSFSLRGISVLKSLNKSHPGKWVRVPLDKGFMSKLNGGSGVYAISIINIKTKLEDVCYIGSAKSIPLRLSNHETILFLIFYLSQSFKIELFVLYTDNIRAIERILIDKMAPFLNKVQAARPFSIKRKDFIKPHRLIYS